MGHLDTILAHFLNSCRRLLEQDRRCRNYFPGHGETLNQIADVARSLAEAPLDDNSLPAFIREYERLLELRASLPRAEEHDQLDEDPPPANDYLATLDCALNDLATAVHGYPLEQRQAARPPGGTSLVDSTPEQAEIIPIADSARASLSTAAELRRALETEDPGLKVPSSTSVKAEFNIVKFSILPGITLDLTVLLRELSAKFINVDWTARIQRATVQGLNGLDAALIGAGHVTESVRRVTNTLFDEMNGLTSKLRRWLRSKNVSESAIGPELKAREIERPSAPPPDPTKFESNLTRILEPLPGLRLLPIPAGEFTMGSKEVDRSAQPEHLVRVPAFLLAETPVSNRQYGLFLEETKHEEPSLWRDRRFPDPDQPVVGVNWNDAGTFCAWLSANSGVSCRLPSEAEWEYAARGADGRRYPWGEEDPTPERACFGLNWSKDKPALVGSFPAGRGPFGTLDQAGLVWEWCADTWHNSYERAPDDGGAWTIGDDSEGRIVRGGAWDDSPENLRAAYRFRDLAVFRYVNIGFRVAAAPASTVDP